MNLEKLEKKPVSLRSEKGTGKTLIKKKKENLEKFDSFRRENSRIQNAFHKVKCVAPIQVYKTSSKARVL